MEGTGGEPGGWARGSLQHVLRVTGARKLGSCQGSSGLGGWSYSASRAAGDTEEVARPLLCVYLTPPSSPSCGDPNPRVVATIPSGLGDRGNLFTGLPISSPPPPESFPVREQTRGFQNTTMGTATLLKLQ